MRIKFFKKKYRNFLKNDKNTRIKRWDLSCKDLNSHLHELEFWKYRRKMRVTRWIWDLLFSLLITGVYSVKPLIMPTLEDIKNKLRSSASIGGYGMGQKVSTKEFGEF